MKIVLRVIGVVLVAIGGFLLLAGRSAATDPLGVAVLLVMGGAPLALGLFLVLKSNKPANKKAFSDVSSGSPVVKEDSAVSPDSIVPPQSSISLASEPDKPLYKKYTFKVAGISRRQKDIINKLLPENDDYEMSKSELVEIGMVDERVYKYSPITSDAELVPEPTNPRDPNAIKVVVCSVHIGYVPADRTGKVKDLLDLRQIHSVTCSFYGGPYKIIREDYDYDKEKEIYTIEKESQYNIGAEVVIQYN